MRTRIVDGNAMKDDALGDAADALRRETDVGIDVDSDLSEPDTSDDEAPLPGRKILRGACG